MTNPPPSPRSLARVGVHFTVAAAQGGGAVWHGRGPHECYWDRQWGARTARHTVATLEELHVPYIVPGGAPSPRLPQPRALAGGHGRPSLNLPRRTLMHRRRDQWSTALRGSLPSSEAGGERGGCRSCAPPAQAVLHLTPTRLQTASRRQCSSTRGRNLAVCNRQRSREACKSEETCN